MISGPAVDVSECGAELGEPLPRLPGMRSVLALSFIALAAAGCARGSGGSAPVDGAQAVRLVLTSDPRFAGIEARDRALIGRGSWYEVVRAADGWTVTVRIGWDDCPSGCIHQRLWTYAVTSSGEVTKVRETGDAIPTTDVVSGTVTAGPTCPVERVPPDPSCGNRRVAGAVLVVQSAAGREVARTISAADGSFHFSLAPGAYRLVAQPVEGVMGTPEPIEFRVESGAALPTLEVSYDTGIR